MHTSAYKTLHQKLLDDLDIDEFLFLKKTNKKIKMSKIALSMAYSMLISAVWFGSTEIGFIVIVASLILIFYFQNKIKHYTELITERNKEFEGIVRKYISSEKFNSFRKAQLNKVKENKLTKSEYIDMIKDEMQLIFTLIKKECNEEYSIDVVAYKTSIDNSLNVIRDAVEGGLVKKEEFLLIQTKWASDLQALCNQYAKTDLEVELKYLQSKIKEPS